MCISVLLFMYLTNIIMNSMSAGRELNRDEVCQAAIMRRVRFIYLVRHLTSPLVLEAALFVVFATVINLSISISSVIKNLSQLSYASEGFSYIWTATIHTKLAVQIVLGASVVLFLFMSRQVYRGLYRFVRNIKTPQVGTYGVEGV